MSLLPLYTLLMRLKAPYLKCKHIKQNKDTIGTMQGIYRGRTWTCALINVQYSVTDGCT